MAARIIILLLFSIRLGAQSETDSFLVEEKDFKGYIMPKHTKWLFSPRLKHQFRPTRNEVFLAEEILRDSFEKTHQVFAYLQEKNKKLDSIYPGYFRQYAGYKSRKPKHRMMYILLVSKAAQQPLDIMKKEWMLGILDGGSILIHVYIDLDEKKIVKMHDNGSA